MYYSILEDKRINAKNISFEISIGDYLDIAKTIIENNEFQRRRVKSSSTIYALLKEDIKIGCVIPPIVLAFGQDKETTPSENTELQEGKMLDFMKGNVSLLVILDGLQRTYTLLELAEELNTKKDEELLKKIRDRKIRIEIYVGVNRLGILYRMLTLNTGQTPMSLRHQIEILYSDYSKSEVEGIRLIKEVDEARAVKLNEYNFSDIISGFNAYLERSELPIEKSDLLENIKGLEKLSRENQNNDIFKAYLRTFHSFIKKIHTLGGEWVLEQENEEELGGHPFGKDVLSIFKKEQVLAAFGAATGKLIDFKIIKDIDDLTNHINKILFQGQPQQGMMQLLKILNEIRNKSKKIGNAQRMYLQYFFRELLNPKTDSYGKIDLAVVNAYQKYLSQI